jgi:hypothetical protein
MSRIPQPVKGNEYSIDDEKRILWIRDVEDFSVDTLQFFQIHGFDDVLTNRPRVQDLLTTLVIEKPVPTERMMEDSITRLEAYVMRFKKVVDDMADAPNGVNTDVDKYKAMCADVNKWVEGSALVFTKKLRENPRPDVIKAMTA